jgi:hypothetical protein
MRVVLDTSVLYGDPRMEGTQSRVLLDGLARISGEIFLPEVVLDELATKVQEQIREICTKAKGAFEQLRDLVGVVETNDVGAVERKALAAAEASVASLRKKCKVVGYPNASPKEAVARELSRRKPFHHDSGAGYRDYLIWLSVLDVARRDAQDVVFITNNSRDFGKAPKLAEDLLADLQAAGRSIETVHYYNGLSIFNKEKMQPLMERLDGVIAKFSVSEFADRIWETALDLLGEHFEVHEDEIAEICLGDGASREVDCVIEALVAQGTKVTDARRLSSGDTVVFATVEVGVDFTIEPRQPQLRTWRPKVPIDVEVALVLRQDESIERIDLVSIGGVARRFFFHTEVYRPF